MDDINAVDVQRDHGGQLVQVMREPCCSEEECDFTNVGAELCHNQREVRSTL